MLKAIAVRLRRGQDLKQEIVRIVSQNDVGAGFVGTCIGSVTSARIRTAVQHGDEYTELEGPFDILSLTGTLAPGEADGCHLHISLGDGDGSVFGGHLQPGTLVATTAEIVLCVLDSISFSRELDNSTGFPELVVNEL